MWEGERKVEEMLLNWGKEKKRNRIAKQAKISTMDCTQKLNAGPKTFYTSFPQ